MALGWLVSAASEITSPMVDAVRTLTRPPGGGGSWTSDNRTHLEVRGLHRPGTAEAARVLEQRLTDVEHVHSVDVNAALGRVVVFHDIGGADPAVLARVVAEVEHEQGLENSEYAPAGARHPGNAGPVLREVGALAASVAGIGYVAAGSLLPIRALPRVVPAALSLTDSVPWIRSEVENRLGRPVTDMILAAGGAITPSLAHQPMSLTVGACQRFCASREVLAKREAWQRWERTTGSRPGIHRAEPLENPPRPCPLPEGPVERVANISGSLALAGSGTVLTTIGSSQRALAMLLAGMPRPAKAGREAFAAYLAGAISARGDLIFDSDTLRRLDRVDTVILDAPTLLAGRQQADRAISPDEEADATELDPLAEDLVEAARSVGAVLVAGRGSRLDRRLSLDGAVPGGNHLLNSVGNLQADGHVVTVVSVRAPSALAAADVGIGLPAESGAVPWGAHILCMKLAHVRTLLTAADKARTVSRHSAILSVGSACFGVLFGSLGPALGATSRASMPVHATTLFALALGTWSGMHATGSPWVPVPSLSGRLGDTPTTMPTRAKQAPGTGT